MLRNYFKLAFRNLWKNKVFSIVNLLGLSVGLVASFCIASYIFHESSFDTYHPDVDNTFRLINATKGSENREVLSAINFLPVAEFIRQEVGEVQAIASIKIAQGINIRVGDKVFLEKEAVWASQTLFDLFGFSFIKGSARKALSSPNSVVLTEGKARKLFGNKDPVGKVIYLDTLAMTVTGVVADLPDNTHLNMEVIGSLSTFKDLSDPWKHQGYLYIKLSDQVSTKEVVEKINSATGNKTWWLKDAPSYHLQRLRDVHLYSSGIIASPGSIDVKYLFIFGIIGLILLFSTAFNYIHLSIAYFSRRSKEVSIRKMMGARKKTLILQSLTECFTLCIIAAVLALILLTILQPYVNTLLDSKMNIALVSRLGNAAFLSVVFIILFLSSSIYPAFMAARLQPMYTFRDGKTPLSKGYGRKGLTVIQFGIAFILIVAVITIHKQLGYISQEKLGFEKEQVLVLNTPHFSKVKTEAIKQQLLRLTGVQHVTTSIGTPFGGGFISTEPIHDKMLERSEFITDHDFVKTLGLKIKEGRDLLPVDSNKVLVNEAMVHAYGWEYPIGQKVASIMGDDLTVIGVVQDFHLNEVHAPVHPIVINLGKQYASNMLVRIETDALATLLAKIQESWKSVEPYHPLEYSFLDEQFQQLYHAEIQFKNLSQVFSGIAIFIACLGLFGLTVFSVRQRTKEIGIRKVLGASAGNVVALLSGDYIKLVLIASMIATPIAWYVMDRWLQDFAYRIELQGWIFALAGLLALVIALLTISLQSVKAALVNPVKSLRSE